MSKYLFILFFIISSIFSVSAQTEGQLSLGIGSISDFYPVKYQGKTYQGTGIGAGFRLGYEQKWLDLSTGHLNLGGILAYGQSDAQYTINNWKSRYVWRHTVMAARITYIYPYDDKLNFYGGLHVGLHIERFTEVYTGTPPANYVVSNYTKPILYTGLILGADYKVADKIGLFGELGYDIMWFTLGAKYYL